MSICSQALAIRRTMSDYSIDGPGSLDDGNSLTQMSICSHALATRRTMLGSARCGRDRGACGAQLRPLVLKAGPSCSTGVGLVAKRAARRCARSAATSGGTAAG